MTDLHELAQTLRDEADRLNQAADLIEPPIQEAAAEAQPINGQQPKHGMSASARRRLSLAAKRRWAERKKQQQHAAA